MLTLVIVALFAQQASWKEFSIGPATQRTRAEASDLSRGILHSGSISLRSLIAIATTMPPVRILGPEEIDTRRYAVSAEVPEPARLRLRTGSPDAVTGAELFRTLLTRELASRFHLAYHRENRDSPVYTLQVLKGRKLNAHAATAGERGRFDRSGTPLINAETALTGKDVTFRAFCDWLEKYLKTPVIPDASLPGGAWNFRVKWRTDSQASLLAALRTQLGVELTEEESNQIYLVVDRVEPQNLP